MKKLLGHALGIHWLWTKSLPHQDAIAGQIFGKANIFWYFTCSVEESQQYFLDRKPWSVEPLVVINISSHLCWFLSNHEMDASSNLYSPFLYTLSNQDAEGWRNFINLPSQHQKSKLLHASAWNLITYCLRKLANLTRIEFTTYLL